MTDNRTTFSFINGNAIKDNVTIYNNYDKIIKTISNLIKKIIESVKKVFPSLNKAPKTIDLNETELTVIPKIYINDNDSNIVINGFEYRTAKNGEEKNYIHLENNIITFITNETKDVNIINKLNKIFFTNLNKKITYSEFCRIFYNQD